MKKTNEIGWFSYENVFEKSKVLQEKFEDFYIYSFKTKLDKSNLEVIIEPTEITFKEIIYIENKDINNVEPTYNDILKIPFSLSENLIRELEYSIISAKSNKNNSNQNKKNQSTKIQNENNSEVNEFEQLLISFLIELFLHNGFKECGRSDEIKALIDSIPLLSGLRHKYSFEYYYKSLVNKDKDDHKLNNEFLIESFSKFKQHYHSYCIFLTNRKNEKYFYGTYNWYNRSVDNELKIIIQNKKDRLAKFNNNNENLNLYKDSFNEADRLASDFWLRRYGFIEVINNLLYNKDEPKKKKRLLIIACLVPFFFVLSLVLFIIDNKITVNKVPVQSETIYLLQILGRLFFFLGFAFTFIISILIFKAYQKVKNLQLIPNIFLPRLTVALISGWIVFLTAEELLKININLGVLPTAISITLISIVLYFFMLSEISDYAPSLRQEKSNDRNIILNVRVLIIISIAFCYSFIFGTIISSHVNKKFLSMENSIVNSTTLATKAERIVAEFREMREKDKYNDAFVHENFLDKIEYVENKYKISIVDYQKLNELVKKFNAKLTANKTMNPEYINNMTKHIDVFKNTLVQRFSDCDGSETIDIKTDLKTFKNDIHKNHTERQIQYMDKLATLKDEYKYNNSEEFISEVVKTGVEIPGASSNDKPKLLKATAVSFLGCELLVFPEMLLINTFLSMFLGIFIQLIIQEKSITEPI